MTTSLTNAAGRIIAMLHTGDDVAPGRAPRPYVLVMTPDGAAVTETNPPDHPHHLGVSVTTPDVDGTNFWGGSTFVAGTGPTILDNHGRQTIEREDDAPGRARQSIAWHDRDGDLVLSEERTVEVHDSAGHTVLAWTSSLNAARDGVSIGSSHTNGRPGAFYGGIFWRTPFGTAEVSTIDGEGVDNAHGSVSPWIVVRGTGATLVAATASGLPWFIRADGYVGFGPAVAVDQRRVIERDSPLELDLAVALLDGEPDDAEIERAIAAALACTPQEVSA